MIVYKVVKEHAGALYSVILISLVLDYKYNLGKVPLLLRYEEGKWTQPPKAALNRGRGVMCFQEMKEAMSFRNNEGGQLWEAEGEGEMKLPPFMPPEYVVQQMSAWLLFKKLTGKPPHTYRDWPEGTMCVSRLMLKRRVS